MPLKLREKIRIGDLLVQKGMLDEVQLNRAIAEQKAHGGKLGDILVALRFIDETQLLTFLAEQLDIPFIQLKHYPLNSALIRKLPELHARRFRAILLEETPDYYLIGMVDPQDIFAFDELSRILKLPLKQALVREADFLQTVDLVYRRTEEISTFAEKLSEEMLTDQNDFDLSQLGEKLGSNEAPVVKLLQSLLEDAIQIHASDIHIEPDEHVLRIRQRVDGVLQEHVMNETRIAPALTLRLKLMARLNIAEKRVPQDGRFSIRIKNRVFDVRLSTMPIQYGESVVMRLLDRATVALHLDDLGMPASLQKKLRKIIQYPNGMLLVTGPTGSGKTTTLYSLLTELNNVETKIITAEDPVEYRLPRISQVQINPHVDLGFAGILRAALRQDPDIIMVGEIRDQETTDIALRAAMTGHLVLATLHTNDAISSVLRLLDMQGESYLVAASLRGVLAQRLLRRICESCTKAYEPTAQEIAWLEFALNDGLKGAEFKRGVGCHQCNQTGYAGRVGVYELLEFDMLMSDALRRNDVAAFSEIAHERQKNYTLIDSALKLAVSGVTTLSEVLRVTMAIEEYTLSQTQINSRE